jgi:uncharacterized phiE125 gp8 family phage protein
MAILDATCVTLAEMRAFLNISENQDTGQDRVIENLLDDLTVAIEDYLGVAIINKAYTDYYDGDGSSELLVKRYPIVTVTSLTVDSTAIASTSYYLYAEQGRIVADGFGFTGDWRNVVLVYTAGWGAARANVPRAIKVALKLWVSVVFKKHVAIINQRFAEGAVVNFTSEDMPDEVIRKLAPYRVIRFVGA